MWCRLTDNLFLSYSLYLYEYIHIHLVYIHVTSLKIVICYVAETCLIRQDQNMFRHLVSYLDDNHHLVVDHSRVYQKPKKKIDAKNIRHGIIQ